MKKLRLGRDRLDLVAARRRGVPSASLWPQEKACAGPVSRPTSRSVKRGVGFAARLSREDESGSSRARTLSRHVTWSISTASELDRAGIRASALFSEIGPSESPRAEFKLRPSGPFRTIPEETFQRKKSSGSQTELSWHPRGAESGRSARVGKNTIST